MRGTRQRIPIQEFEHIERFVNRGYVLEIRPDADLWFRAELIIAKRLPRQSLCARGATIMQALRILDDYVATKK